MALKTLRGSPYSRVRLTLGRDGARKAIPLGDVTPDRAAELDTRLTFAPTLCAMWVSPLRSLSACSKRY